MNWIKTIQVLKRRAFPSKYGWSGDYHSWQEAKSQCTGYDSSEILQKVTQSALKVKNGEEAYERDGVLFKETAYSWPLLSGLMYVAALNKGLLHVLDFGGSLGSSYYQNKNFLDSLDWVNWSVIEQESFVETGKKYFEDKTLRFFASIEESISATKKPDVLLLSCTLPYLEDPLKTLEFLESFKIPYLIVDNTYFNFQQRDRICIQTVPPWIYEASYPCWLLDYNKLKALASSGYTIMSEHHNDSVIYIDGRAVRYQGFFGKLK